MLSAIKAKFDKAKDILANVATGTGTELSYVVEHRDWIIRRIGQDVTGYLNRQKLLKSRITTAHQGLNGGIVHFGSINTFIRKENPVKTHKLSKIVLTWFHIRDNDEVFVDSLVQEPQRVAKIHTACRATKDFLVSRGFPQEKISVIPLGVNLNVFSKAHDRAAFRQLHGIPKDALVIGSFQKDGVGWTKGSQAKMIKGPDIFAEVVAKLKDKYPVFVLLVGPARGWLEAKLKDAGVPYKSIGYLKNADHVSRYYHLLDIYLITSRLEGGPQQILEAWASGVPVVATRVGMIPDIAVDEKDTLLADSEDVKGLFDRCARLAENPQLRLELAEGAAEKVKEFSWDKIAERYYQEIYRSI